ncbi:helix-turn-helix domain-containing protein [Streptomyces sp. B3I8]|uniref:helix-turn-helix domain-containing protein n=1 Tax=Streptomyces sp. B3I8 TaxID=3042303 RepID=UPI00358E4303
MPPRGAYHLLELCTRDEAGLVVHATQDEVARAVGPVREVVARTLRDFAHEGLIARGPRAIRLVGPRRVLHLRHLALGELLQQGGRHW